MLSIEPSIVFIDDKEEEVKGIIESYRNEGRGVKFFNADLINGDSKPDNEYSDVNLVFLDLYYDVRFDVEVCTGWIEKIIPKYSYYILVIWSKDTQHEDEIIADLTKLERLPFKIISVQKGDVYKKDNGEWDFNKLNIEVQAKLEEMPELEELAVWKKGVKNSSNLIIGHLSKGIPAVEFRKKLQKIILGHGGSYLIGQDKLVEKRKVLFDALDSVLSSNSIIKSNIADISETNRNTLYNTSVFPISDVDSKLNSWFHFKLIEEDDIGKSDISPGLISINNNPFLKRLYSILDDPKLNPKFQTQINSQETKIEDITVVIVRPCDYAQNKFGKNIKLLSGIKITNPKRLTEGDLSKNQRKDKEKYLGRLDINLNEIPDSVIIFDRLYFSKKESDVTLIFDFRYVFSIPEKIFNTKFENIKVFNKELLSEIQVEYSSYSSRLGITQII